VGWTALECAQIMRREETVKLVQYLRNTQEPVFRDCNTSLIRIANYPDIIALLETYQNTPLPLVYLGIQKVRELLRTGKLDNAVLVDILKLDWVKPFGLESVFIEDENAAEIWSEAHKKTRLIDSSDRLGL